jgi:glycosyltransferase involved in cell wall biosynthesis
MSTSKSLSQPSRKIKIIHVITNLSVGGAEMMLYKLLSQLEDVEFKNIVISLRERGEIGKKIEALGIPVFNLGMPRGIPSLSGTFKLVKKIRDHSPDILQGWMYHGNLAATFGANLGRIRSPVLWNIRQSLYGFHEERLLSRIAISAGAKFSKKVKKIIYNSNISRDQHEKFGYSSPNGAFIPNGFELEKFSPDHTARISLRKELKIPVDNFLVGLIARYHPMKGHDTFFKAAKQLLFSHPSVHFVLAGTGVNNGNERLVGQIKALGLMNVVHLLGERMDISRITAGLDIATSCSFTIEGFSNAIGEAMACAVPVVATDVGDASFLVQDTGKIISPNNPKILAQAWKEFIDMGRRGREQWGLKGRERIKNSFGLEAVSNQYKNLYQSVI